MSERYERAGSKIVVGEIDEVGQGALPLGQQLLDSGKSHPLDMAIMPELHRLLHA